MKRIIHGMAQFILVISPETYAGTSFFAEHQYAETMSQSDVRLNYDRTFLESADKWPKMGFYAGVLLEQMISELKDTRVASQKTSPLVGLQLKSGYLTLFTELRTTFHTSQHQSFNEARIGLVASHFAPFSKRYFGEAYFESVSVPRITPTPVSMGWYKLGIRQRVLPSMNFDGYFGFWGKVSPDSNLGLTSGDLRAGLRLGYQIASFQFSIEGHQKLRSVGDVANDQELFLTIQGGNI